jgi:NAD(P)-dependent dehydrogenase (short-subunit alcohol dehydrogenase family)
MPEDAGAQSRFDLTGRVAVVTGASRGIGAAIAGGLAAAGARVFGLSRGEAGPAGVTPIVCDLTDHAAIARAFAQVDSTAGRLDILVNAAGLSLPPAGTEAPAQVQRFRRTLDLDLTAPYVCVLAALPTMRKAGGGAIINITSINSGRGFPNNPGYVAAKAGLAGLTRALAVDLAPHRIRVNALAPGYVHTAMTEASFKDAALNEQRRRHTLLGRWGTPDDMVGAAVFLASDASAYITGQEIFVDGGWTVNGLVG